MPRFLTPALILSSHVRLGPASGLFLSSKVSSVSLTANMCAACPSHLYGFRLSTKFTTDLHVSYEKQLHCSSFFLRNSKCNYRKNK